MHQSHCALAGTLAFILLLQGCSVTDSENVKIAGISADIQVTSNSSNTDGHARVTVNLQSGSGFNGTDLKLTGGDRLYVTVDGQRFTLSQSSDPISTYYEALVPSTSTHTEYLISFEREEDTSAPTSTVMLPEPFDIQALAQDEYGFDENINLQWSPAGSDKVILQYNFDCRTQSGARNAIVGLRPGIQDDGDHTVDLSDLISKGEDPLTSCDGEIRIRRAQTGRLDPNFGEGGSIEGVQQRKVTFDVS